MASTKLTKSARAKKLAKTVGKFILSQWFYCLLAPLIAIAAEFPEFARHGGTIKAQYTIGYGAIALIFLQNGLSMRTNVFLKHLSDWRAHIMALSFQFLITPSIAYGICCGIRAAKDSKIDNWILAGAIVTGTCPTTIASNVVMTRKAKGSFEKSISAVFAGNLFGSMVSPLLVQMFFSSTGWEFANPRNGTSFAQVYRRVMKQLGLSVFIPLFVGQCILNINPEKILAFNAKYKLNKIGSVCLLLNIFTSFSTAFYQHAFTSVPGASIIMIFFFNVGIYLLFTVMTLVAVRNPLIKPLANRQPSNSSSRLVRWSLRFITPFYFSPQDSISMIFVCPAKSTALGIALVTSQYGDNSPHLGKLLAAIVLYSTEQVLVANFLVVPLRKWSLQSLGKGGEKDIEKGKQQDGSDDIESVEEIRQEVGVENGEGAEEEEVGFQKKEEEVCSKNEEEVGINSEQKAASKDKKETFSDTHD